MRRIRIAVADDHPIVRQGIRGILEPCPDLEIAGEAASGDEVEELCDRLQPDVLLLDVSMPGRGFFEVLRALGRKPGGPAVLVFSMHTDSIYARRAFEAGAAGYLSKPRSLELLPKAIRAVAGGGTFSGEYPGPETTGGAPDERAPHSRLSSREFQIFLMLGEGMRVVEIAAKLGRSPKTVSTHRARILEKMKLDSNAAIVRYVNASGLLD